MDHFPVNIQRSKLSEQIADQLEEEIISSGKVGERLASEQQLAERFSASRTIVREALKILRARGLIASRTGSGAYVTSPNVEDLSHMLSRMIRMNGIGYKDIYDMRYYMEAAAVRAAAEKASDAELDQLEEILFKLKNRNLGFMERRDLDFRFHERIAHMSGNALLSLMVETMAHIFKDVIEIGIFVEGGIDDAIIRHQRIMDALRLRDAVQAEKMVYEHLKQSRRNYEVYYKLDTK